ncbi:hypothetical protein B5M42_016680 [Paenibacillus athensensis]|uniref:hypothetical protein n=1 Tax=Paenibacillus athensensis TaxID=1967502 RepID=UPI00106F84AF|nr:hypothetical protein [Paenibacillus athensensis]MCD1260437.1 hypothetical protein [Paenibacillus athensensis]
MRYVGYANTHQYQPRHQQDLQHASISNVFDLEIDFNNFRNFRLKIDYFRRNFLHFAEKNALFAGFRRNPFSSKNRKNVQINLKNGRLAKAQNMGLQ